MKKVLITILALGIFCISGFAQEETSPTPAATAKIQRPKLLEELGLTREQAQQIRQINVQRQPLIRQAQIQVRIAQEALDAAIYADIANEDDIKEKVKALQIATAEVTKIRTFTEYSIRKILTAEQLVKFRSVREKLLNLKREKQESIENRKTQIPNRRIINRAAKP